MPKKEFCGDCEEGWVRKVDYDRYFDIQVINKE